MPKFNMEAFNELEETEFAGDKPAEVVKTLEVVIAADAKVEDKRETVAEVVKEKEEVVEEKKEPDGDGEDLSSLKLKPENKSKVEDKKDEKKDEKPAEETEDTFKIPEKKEPTATPDSVTGAYKLDEIAKDFAEIGIKPEEITDNKVLVAKVKELVEASKQKVELDLSKYDDETKNLVTFLESGGTAKDFLDPIGQYNDMLMLSPEEKYKISLESNGVKKSEIENLMNDLDHAEKELRVYLDKYAGKSKAQIDEIIDELITDDKLLAVHKQQMSKLFDADVKDLKKEAQEKVIDTYNKKVEQLKQKDIQQAADENNKLIESVAKIDEYRGMKIPQQMKDFLKLQIETGEFHKMLNTPEAQIKAFLEVHPDFKQQLDAFHEKRIKDASREGYNNGKEKVTKKLHNIPNVDVISTHDKSSGGSPLKDAAKLMEDGAN